MRGEDEQAHPWPRVGLWRGRAAYGFLAPSAAGLSSVVLTLVFCFCDSSTLVVCPPISMLRSPFSSRFSSELSMRPLSPSHRTTPPALLLARLAALMRNGNVLPAAGSV